MRLVLDEAALRDLVSGREVRLLTTTARPVELILADIGWQRIVQAVEDAMSAAGEDALLRRLRSPPWPPSGDGC